MGMDVYGKHPTSEIGKYFRNNVWWWRPLWDYCAIVAPKLAGKVEHGQTNDGDGLNAIDSQALAAILRTKIKNGEAKRYEDSYTKRLAAIPDELCEFCKGTGKRSDMPKQPKCNGCEGKGKRRPSDTWYPFSVENVQQFAAFLDECGGFEIC